LFFGRTMILLSSNILTDAIQAARNCSLCSDHRIDTKPPLY
jgi:hypothetical protein